MKKNIQADQVGEVLAQRERRRLIAFDAVKRAWSIVLCKNALEALIKYGAPKSEYDALKAAMKSKR